MTIAAASLPSLHLQPLPEVDLRQMTALSDDTGILQHAAHSVAKLEYGYCTDDMARALIIYVITRHLLEQTEPAEALPTPGAFTLPIQRGLAFLAHAFNESTNRFRNFMGYDRRWLEETGSEDSHGRAIWALGVTARFAPNSPVRQHALDLLKNALPSFLRFENCRPLAFGLIGLHEVLLDGGDDEELRQARQHAANALFQLWRDNASADWPWWENTVTWGNGKLCEALLVAGDALNNRPMIQAGLRALNFLLAIQTAPEGHLSLIGNDGWFPKGGAKARFDQQPLDAEALLAACLAAARITGEARWMDEAKRCFEWFRGRNDLATPLYHEETGGCQDGLGEEAVNLNQGAESTMAYILAVLQLHLYQFEQSGAMASLAVRLTE